PESYRRRTGRRPLEHLAALGVLGPHVLLGHAVHLDDAELDVLLGNEVAVAACPWAYLRLGQGVTTAGRYADLVRRGGRIALGCDSENAGDAVDLLLAARLFAGLVKDATTDPCAIDATAALGLATIDGARAIGLDHEIGSLDVGKRADIVVVDTTGPEWTPISPDRVLQLIWASDGRAVRDVVASGRVVVRDHVCTTVDHRELAAQGVEAGNRLIGSRRAHPRDE
ncbi:MAG: amidohydrolase family protein, partial [Ilumatobacteraceae bacterium]